MWQCGFRVTAFRTGPLFPEIIAGICSLKAVPGQQGQGTGSRVYLGAFLYGFIFGKRNPYLPPHLATLFIFILKHTPSFGDSGCLSECMFWWGMPISIQYYWGSLPIHIQEGVATEPLPSQFVRFCMPIPSMGQCPPKFKSMVVAWYTSRITVMIL